MWVTIGDAFYVSAYHKSMLNCTRVSFYWYHHYSRSISYPINVFTYLEFNSESDMWFQNPPDLFKCTQVKSSGAENGDLLDVSFIDLYRKIMLVCLLMAIGRCTGE